MFFFRRAQNYNLRQINIKIEMATFVWSAAKKDVAAATLTILVTTRGF